MHLPTHPTVLGCLAPSPHRDFSLTSRNMGLHPILNLFTKPCTSGPCEPRSTHCSRTPRPVLSPCYAHTGRPPQVCRMKSEELPLLLPGPESPVNRVSIRTGKNVKRQAAHRNTSNRT